MTSILPLLPRSQLPFLPHPTSLIALHDISPHLLEQAQQDFTQLSSLRNDVASGETCDLPNLLPIPSLTRGISAGYDLSPPGPSTLPPLPPIPQPPIRHRAPRRSSLVTPSSIPKPEVIPTLPPNFQGRRSPQECVDTYNEAESSSGAALRYADSAVLVTLKGVVVWVLLRSARWDDGGISRVESVMVHVVRGEEVPAIHVQPQPGPCAVLSKHLTKLSLTLPQLLHRLPAIPSLLDGSCFYCQKFLKMPDGLPLQQTGWMASIESWVGWHESCGNA